MNALIATPPSTAAYRSGWILGQRRNGRFTAFRMAAEVDALGNVCRFDTRRAALAATRAVDKAERP